jgi:hypothetical protein
MILNGLACSVGLLAVPRFCARALPSGGRMVTMPLRGADGQLDKDGFGP